MLNSPYPFSGIRWLVALWIVIWLPSYIRVWGLSNLLHLCDIAVLIACVGLWFGNSLLLSSQAVSLLIPGVLWCADIGSRLLTGRYLVGGTNYMWDAQYPLWVRLLSLFHLWLPVVLFWALRRTGYDRRGPALQAAIAGGLLVISRFWPTQLNLNYAHRDPLFHRTWGNALTHLGLTWIVLVALLYGPAHAFLRSCLPSVQEQREAQCG